MTLSPEIKKMSDELTKDEVGPEAPVQIIHEGDDRHGQHHPVPPEEEEPAGFEEV